MRRHRRQGFPAPAAAADPVGPGAPDPGVRPLLEDMERLRLTLVADLSVAASALDAGHPDVAADVVNADCADLEEFRRNCLGRLRTLSPYDPRAAADGWVDRPDASPASPGAAAGPAPRPLRRGLPRVPRSRWVPAAPLVGAAAAVAAIVAGVVPGPAVPARRPDTRPAAVQTQPVAQTWRLFAVATSRDASAGAVIAAATRLHASLSAMVKAAPGDPAQGWTALTLLLREQRLLLQERPAGMEVVLGQVRGLLDQLRRTLHTAPPSALVAPLPVDESVPAPHRSSTPASPGPSTGESRPTSTSSPSAKPPPEPSGSPAPSVSPSGSDPTGDPTDGLGHGLRSFG